jgi:hypothetical protein
MADVPNPTANPQANPSGGSLAAAVNGLIQVVMSLPVWLRAVVIVMLLAGASAFVYLKYLRPPAPTPTQKEPVAVATDSSVYFSRPGVPDPNHPLPTDPQTTEARDKAAEDEAAFQYHFVHVNDENPPLVALGPDTDSSNSLHYRYYASTDRCLFIDRTESGAHFTQWLQDPQFHFHNIHHTAAQAAVRLSPASIPADDPPLLPSRFIPSLIIAPPLHLGQPTSAGGPAQAGFCVNPHPGQFRYWWGPPRDQCNSPMYRQFADGCTHYQLYNRCANAWDGRINWTVCNRPPHR